MSKVLFRVNLGSIDAKRLGIDDWRQCQAGAEVDVSDEAAKALEASGVVIVVPDTEAARRQTRKASEMRADPENRSDIEAK